ncbi:hypothetical protein [Jeongeupia naejangsanensis]|uniref:Uncharacterized protein n=1 Tax=Jeongeupia naejangsanensis TaxID=613195 RepID=A0ABS2BSU4_9NEIS|nr:hypothetical protein [Jeongeupia naejangsanensis]MBM3117889.1 hypothetical protein [Jeongeupia naejangsanensis]
MDLDQTTLQHWMKFDTWKPREAVLILSGLHPDSMTGSGIKITSPLHELPPEFAAPAALYQIFSRYKWADTWSNRMPGNAHPTWFYDIACEKGVALPGMVCTAFDELFDAEEPGKTSAEGHSELRESERKSLYKIVIGLAAGGYRYKAGSRNTSLSEMLADIQKLGLSIDGDTLRKWLKEAESVLE